MNKKILPILCIGLFLWLFHSIYLIWLTPALTFSQALFTGLTIPDIIFRTLLLLIGFFCSIKFFNNRGLQFDEYTKLKKAVDTSGEVIFITDRNGIFTYINPEFSNVYGFTPEEVIGKNTPRILKSNVMSPENYEKFWQHILQKQVVKGEIINKTKSGVLIDVESSANPIVNAKDEIIGFLSIQRDITERKIKEKKLFESEKTARAMLNALENPVYLVDKSGEILSANEAGMNTLSISPDKLVGKNIKDFSLFVQTEQYDKILESIKNMKKIRYEDHYADRFYDVIIYPLFDVQSHVYRIVIFNIDVTDQKQNKQTIRQQNKFLNSVIEALEHPFFVIDVKNYKVKLANSAAKGAHELYGVPCYALTHNASEPCSTSNHLCPLVEMKKTKQPVVTHHVHFDQNGKKRHVEVHAFPILDDEGELSEMIEYTLDITDHKRPQKSINSSSER